MKGLVFVGISIQEVQDWLRERNSLWRRQITETMWGWEEDGTPGLHLARGEGRAPGGLALNPTGRSSAKESRHIGNPKIGVSWPRARTVAVGDTAIRSSETRASLKAH